jgi:Cft2 family RNA processing exonuclease
VVGGAKFPSRHFEVVVTETTRGATERPSGQDRASEVARLIRTINHIIDRGGSVLIPVFALGRLQELLVILHQARATRQLKPATIFSSGLGMDLCDYFDEIARKTGLANFSRSILRDLPVKPTPRNVVAGRDLKEKGIFLLSSGMMVENTPSYLLASCFVGHSHNGICFVGYCDPETPGGRLLAARRGETYVFEALNVQAPVRASVERFEMTGHADREELLEFVLNADPRAVVLTHGDPPARDWFKEAIGEQRSSLRVLDPVPLQTYEL